MPSSRASRRSPLPVLVTAIVAACAPALFAADPVINTSDDIRIAPQIMVGTAGFEPGVALEYRPTSLTGWNFRPEVFLSEDVRVGAGLAALYDFSPSFSLPADQRIEVGPRAVYHNSDHNGWEGDAMAEYAYSLDNAPKPFTHTVGLLGDLGIREHKDDGGDKKLELGASIGAFYSYRF